MFLVLKSCPFQSSDHSTQTFAPVPEPVYTHILAISFPKAVLIYHLKTDATGCNGVLPVTQGYPWRTPPFTPHWYYHTVLTYLLTRRTTSLFSSGTLRGAHGRDAPRKRRQCQGRRCARRPLTAGRRHAHAQCTLAQRPRPTGRPRPARPLDGVPGGGARLQYSRILRLQR